MQFNFELSMDSNEGLSMIQRPLLSKHIEIVFVTRIAKEEFTLYPIRPKDCLEGKKRLTTEFKWLY